MVGSKKQAAAFSPRLGCVRKDHFPALSRNDRVPTFSFFNAALKIKQISFLHNLAQR
jgi:hypothetical protein